MKQEVDWLRVYRYFMREEGEEAVSYTHLTLPTIA